MRGHAKNRLRGTEEIPVNPRGTEVLRRIGTWALASGAEAGATATFPFRILPGAAARAAGRKSCDTVEVAGEAGERRVLGQRLNFLMASSPIDDQFIATIARNVIGSQRATDDSRPDAHAASRAP
jgi:hypothetical protein